MTDPKNNQTPQPPAVQYLTGHYPAVRDDEIDLKELILGLWAEKWLIVGITTLCTAIALTYALLATPYFKTEAKLRPAPKEYFLEINNADVINVSSEEVFFAAYAAMESRSLQKEFFFANRERFGLYFNGATDDQAFSAFFKGGFSVNLPDDKKDKGRGLFLSITYVAPSLIEGEAVVDAFIKFSNDKVYEKYLTEYRLAKMSRLESLNAELALKNTALEQAISVEVASLKEADAVAIANLTDQKAAILLELKQKRLNRIEQLKEALAIAERMEIKEPKTISSFASQSKLDRTQGGTVITEVNSGDQPLYLMGTIALTAEIEVLRSRVNEAIADSRIADIDRRLAELKTNRKIAALNGRLGNDLFFKGIDALKTEMARLESLPDSFKNFVPFQVMDVAYTDPAKVKPKRALICMLGLVIGGMFGFFTAFIKRVFATW